MLQVVQNRNYFSSNQKTKNYRTINIIRKSNGNLFLTLMLFGLSFVANAQCSPILGNQTSYGSSSWIGYVYNGANTFVSSSYKGYLTQPEIFNQDVSTGSISGSNLCGTYADQFTIRYKMQKTLAAGNYSFIVGGDDGYRLSFDGGATFPINNWTDHAYTATTLTYFLSGTINFVLEYYENGGYSRVSFSYGNCSIPSTDATSITGTNAICSGNSTTLTAVGGTNSMGSVYQWGTGATIGSNIIVGQSSASITITPAATTTYWVRKIDPTPCTVTTAGITQTVTVSTLSTAPTSITGTTTLCLGNSTTLTATGGSLATGSTYEWGTGSTVGSNTLGGQTASTLTVTPLTSTTYWVRRVDPAPCSSATAGVSTTVSVNLPSGDQTSYGSGTWIGYVYAPITAVPPADGFSTNYRGYVTQPEIFDQDYGSGSISGANLCGTYADQFAIRFKMLKNFTTGYYTFTVGGDDGYRLSLDGGVTFLISNWGDHSYTTSTSATIYLSGNTNLVLEYYENGGGSRVSYNYTSCTSFSSAPTSISGTSSLCATAGGTTLTATGGFEASGATYQWGTGSTIGSNIIAGATNSSYYINPASTTTYWVRRVDGAPCNLTTTGVSQTITVATQSTIPTTISGTTTICSGNSTTLTASGGTMGTGAVFQWGSGYSAGVNIITGATGNSITVSPTTMTGYWVRRIDPAPCNTNTGQITTTVNVNAISTAPTSITGAATATCSGTPTTLTATGGSSAAGSSYQWGTGTTVGSNIITGQTAVSIIVSPTTVTTYWVRRIDTVCPNTTSEASQLVTVTATTIAGTLSCAATTICKSTTPSPIVLTGNLGTIIKWQYATDLAFTVGVTDIASTATTLTSALIGSLSTTRYFRAVVQNGNCAVAYTTPMTITVPATLTFNGSWNGTPTATTPVIISGNLTLSSDLNVCSCQVSGTAVVTVPANVSLIVQKDITVASTANIIINDKGSLVQVDDAAANIGNITFKRNSTPLKQYDYTYWSSPLVSQTLGQLASSSLFYSFNPNINNWAYELATTTMTVAKGYIARAPNNLNYATPQTTSVTFTGVPNSGVINAPIVKTTGTTYNLIGNPYPSAIDIDAFLLDPANSSVVNGTIYLWTHNTAISNSIPGNTIYNYTRDDYAKYNITGGVKTASTALSGGITPTGKIAAGQGFFIEANAALANGSYQAKFNNGMRVAGNNNQFFKVKSIISNPSQNEAISNLHNEKHRVWISVSNNDGAYDETLVGYVTGATNDLDNLYDGKTLLGSNVVSLYSILNTNTLAIQGRALPFSDSDFISLGFTTTITGNFKIGLENFDGLFSGQNIYLLDKTTNTYYDLKAQPFTFNIQTSGTFNNRFELHFSSIPALANSEFDYSNSVQIIRKDKHIAVKTGNENINSIQVFDLLGKTVYTKNKIESSEFNSTDLNISSQVLVVKVTLDNDQVVTQKVLMN